MLLAPRPGHHYRDTRSKQLVPKEGAQLDPTDLDVARAIDCGDLLPVNPKKAASAAQAKD